MDAALQWALGAGVGWVLIGSVLAVFLVTVGRYTGAAEAMRFFWCAMTHQRWHVVQHERPTLTRLYCTRCGHVHLKYKRLKDHGKPTTSLPD